MDPHISEKKVIQSFLKPENKLLAKVKMKNLNTVLFSRYCICMFKTKDWKKYRDANKSSEFYTVTNSNVRT